MPLRCPSRQPGLAAGSVSLGPTYVNSTDFFAALAGVPGARTVAVEGNGIAESRFVAGVEIARAVSADERALRRAWRERSRGGPDPLLVVADDPDREGAFLALGPLGGG